MKRNTYTLFFTLLLSSCLSQTPAPIEFGSPKANRSSYSERTSSKVSEDGEIKRRELVSSKLAKSNGEFSKEEEIFTEYKEQKTFPEASQDDRMLETKEVDELQKQFKKNLIIDEKKHQSLEDEMNEDEAKQSDEVSAQNSKVEEIVRPDKVVVDEDDVEKVIDTKFSMPVSGKIVTKFGDDNGGKKSNGINISARRGMDVKSIAAGKVVYAGQDPKFGNLIIVKVGATEMFAAYAHMDDLLLQKDDDVIKGQVIGHVGSTGNVANPELHFALRKGKTPVDPMKFMIVSNQPNR